MLRTVLLLVALELSLNCNHYRFQLRMSKSQYNQAQFSKMAGELLQQLNGFYSNGPNVGLVSS